MYNDRTIRKEHKIVMIDDSHSRDYAAEVKNRLANRSEVIGLVKSDAGAEILVTSSMSDKINLTTSDVVVFCGGSNNVSKNNSNIAFKHILNLINSYLIPI
jgi:hypothetical protein